MADDCLLYYITDRTGFPGGEPGRRRRLLEKISEATRAGVDYIQLRENDLSTRELESLARDAVDIIRQSKQGRTQGRELRTLLLINSRTDLVLAVHADGVHLRSDDISPTEVRRVWQFRADFTPPLSPHDPVVAVSCHSPSDVAQAKMRGAAFAVFGPVFEKQGASPAGVALLREACASNIPVLALGGITLTNARSCLDAGAAGIAAIRLFQENNIAEVAQRLRSNP